MKSRFAHLAGVFVLGSLLSVGASADDLKPFPAPAPGQERFVIRLPEIAAPQDVKVELILAKTLQVDCNRLLLGGTLAERTARGWGFSYYVIERLAEPASTLMACPPGSGTKPESVRIRTTTAAGAENGWLRYNHQLPVVVYVPAGVVVSYRLWKADPRIGTASAE